MKNQSQTNWPGWSILGLGMLAALAVVTIRLSGFVSEAEANDPKAPDPTIAPSEITVVAQSREEVPPPPDVWSWLDKSGLVAIPKYDDRRSQGTEPAVVINPRWTPFNRCLQSQGYGSDGPIVTQEQAQGSVQSINQEGPFLRRSSQGGLELVRTSGLDAFESCAYILELPAEEVAPLLEPGDPVGHPPVR